MALGRKEWEWRGAIVPLFFFAYLAIDLIYFPRHELFPDEKRLLSQSAMIAWEMPGPHLVFWLLGYNLPLIRTVQALLLVGQCWLIDKLARNRWAMLVALAYPPLIYYQGLALSETLFDTFFLAGFLLLDRHFLKTSTGVFVIALYMKATITVLPIVLIAVSAPRKVMLPALIYVAMLVPWWGYTYARLGQVVWFTTGAADNLYVGNNKANQDGGNNQLTDVDMDFWQPAIHLPELERGPAMTKAALAYIVEDPWRFIHHLLQQFIRLWTPIPNDPGYQHYWPLLMLTYWPILCLAMINVLTQWQARMLPIVLTITYFTLIHSITIASLRYRLPLEPLLITLALVSP